MSIIQQIVSDLLQTWPNFQHTAADIMPWHLWLILAPLFLLTFGAPFMDAFFCLRRIHRLQPRFPGDADIPRYKAARTKLVLTTCLLYGLGIFFTYPNTVTNPTDPNPAYLYAVGIIALFIAAVNYRRSGLFISTVFVSLMFCMELYPVLGRFFEDSEYSAVGILTFMIASMSFVFPADIWAYHIFGVYCMDDITELQNPGDKTTTKCAPTK